MDNVVRDRFPSGRDPGPQRGGSGLCPQTSGDHRKGRPQRVRLLGLRRRSTTLPIPGRTPRRATVPYPRETQRHPCTGGRMPPNRPGKTVLRTRRNHQTSHRGVDTPPTPPLITHPPRRNRIIHHPPSQKPTPRLMHDGHIHQTGKRSHRRTDIHL